MNKDIQQLFMAAQPLIDFVKKYVSMTDERYDYDARQALNDWDDLRGSIGIPAQDTHTPKENR